MSVTDQAPLVSVVVPAYNALTFLPETLDSALAQTFTDFEVIAVNDGSTDGTGAWLDALNDPRIKVIHQENKGLPATRNTGIRHARGTYIAFLDADDLWDKTKLAKQVAVLEAQPEVGLVHTGITFIDAQGQAINQPLGVAGEGDVRELLLQYNPVRCGSTPVVRRACFGQVGDFDESLTFSEDWEMYIRLALSYDFAVVDEPLVAYRQHDNNMSKKYLEMMQVFETIIEKSFGAAPSELSHIKPKAYAFAYLHSSWRALFAGDTAQADTWLSQAFQKNPRLRTSKNALHLAVRIKLLNWFGMQDWPNLKRSQPSSSDLG